MPSRGLFRWQEHLRYLSRSWVEKQANESIKAIENAHKSIRLEAVALSYVSGPMMKRFLDQAPAVKASLLRDLAMRRLVDPEEVADAVVFSASSSASYINGHTLVVDGGSSLQLSNTPFSN